SSNYWVWPVKPNPKESITSVMPPFWRMAEFPASYSARGTLLRRIRGRNGFRRAAWNGPPICWKAFCVHYHEAKQGHHMRVAFITDEPFFPPRGGWLAEGVYFVQEFTNRGH